MAFGYLLGRTGYEGALAWTTTREQGGSVIYQHTIAKIEETHLGYEDHNIFSITVGFSYGSGSHQGMGPIGFKGDLIKAICDAAGVACWEKLVGRTVYAVRDPGWTGLVRGIAPLPTEKGQGFILTTEGEIQKYQPPKE